jgi:hypothetical protein
MPQVTYFKSEEVGDGDIDIYGYPLVNVNSADSMRAALKDKDNLAKGVPVDDIPGFDPMSK